MAQFYADRVAVGSHRAHTPEGYLLCKDIPFARTGIQVYKENEVRNGGNSDIEVKVFRPYDEVFHPATLASFEGKAVTSPHPPRFLDPNNWGQFARGHVQNVRQGPKLADGEFALMGDLLITDADLINRIESNLVTELSAGYDTEYVPDEHSPDIYKQTKIRGNHVAVVPSGRAGVHVKILDSKEETAVAETTAVVDDKVSVGALTGLLRLLGIGSRATADSESEAVRKNEEVNAEALRRAKVRNQDAEEEKEKEKKAEDKRLKDAEEEKKKKKEAEDAEEKKEQRMVDSITKRILDAFEKKKKEEDEEKDPEKKEEKDSDLIPVETMSGKEVPKNPIPGADKAMDRLRALKPIIAATRDRKAIDTYNEAVRELKGGSTDAYASLVSTKKPEAVENSETQLFGSVATDAKVSDDFVVTAAKFHRRNPGEAAAQLKTAGKE